MTYSAPIFVRARFMNPNTGEIKEQTVFMGDFPMMTDKGTFIINGTERVVVSQLVRSPGVIFQPGERYRLRNLAKHQLVTGTIHPYRGEWIEFDVEQKPGKDLTAGTRVARKRRLQPLRPPARPRLRRGPLPRVPRGLRPRVLDFLEGQWEKERDLAPTQEEALVEIYKRARPGEPPVGRVGPRLLPQRLLREPALRPHPGRPLQAQPQARRRARPPGRDLPDAEGRQRRRRPLPRPARRRPGGAQPLRGPRRLHLPAAPRPGHARATASTTRTTSPTGASARSAS